MTGVRSFLSRGPAGKLVALIALSAAFGVGLAAQPAAAGFRAKGRVTFGHKSCSFKPFATTTGAPLQHALVRFFHEGKQVAHAETNKRGHFSAHIGQKRVTAQIVLDGGEFQVVPRVGATPYNFDYPGAFTPEHPTHRRTIYRVGYGPAAGAMNIFNTLQDGVFAAGTLAREAGMVRAAWGPLVDLPDGVDLPKSGSYYTPAARRIALDGDGKALGDEWEPWVILHEYGHHVLHSTHAVGGMFGGEHYLDRAYPDRPALAWSEGFGDAFGAIAADLGESRDGRHEIPPGAAFRSCTKVMNLSSTPPSPTPPANNAQYNETAAASVIWALASRFGSDSTPRERARGLQKLVRLARRYFRPPEDMHDVRGALTSVPLVETTPAESDAIDKIFGRRGHMAWGKGVTFVPTSVGGGAPQLALRLTGPPGYDTCKVADQFDTFILQGTGEGPFPGASDPGGLGYTWQDDCLNFSDDNTPNGPPEAPTGGTTFGELILSHPFLANDGHRQGPFNLYATWLCQDIPPAPPDFPGSPCDPSAEYQVIVCTPVGSFGPGDPCAGNLGGGAATVTLDENEILVLDFTADARQCHVYGDSGTVSCAGGVAW